ncbi:MAG: ATP-binding cassette domain-containing protein [Deltaproteobacteria bacterium]|uniref:ATP-binding cassette domain-containing protein n=1 Tax=Candidatus Zymogenus saltonus TaxID=2844893 RepID=A0A9D8PNM4_9DELT|nr:ATP-binding cassette domain-containing protein [Candidatus Zymogenus saltonus]
MIHLSDVHLSFDSASGIKNRVLNGVDLHIPRGKYAALIGPNGSGKTTIAKIIKGLITPDSGTVKVAGKTISHEELMDNVGLVFSNPENQIVSAVVEEDIAFGLENQGVPTSEMKELVSTALKRLNLYQLRKMPPHHLSGGEQQRLVIAGILVLGSEILILDEATSMLDSKGRRDILSLIRDLNRREGLTVLSITHSLVEAVLSDLVLALDGGEIIFCGPPLEFLFNDGILERLKINLPEFLILIRRLVDEGVDLPPENVGIEGIVNALENVHGGI